MLCVEISAKQGMLIFRLDKHLVYGSSQIATVLAPAQSMSQCISVRALGAPSALPVPARPCPDGPPWAPPLHSLPGCHRPPGNPTISAPQAEQ